MAKRKLDPVFFPIIPPNGGINISVAPNAIATRESPKCLDVRFQKKQLCVRNGFKLKYSGCRETPLWIDVIYSGGFTNLVVFGQKGVFYESGDVFVLCPLYDGVGGTESYPYFTMDPSINSLNMDVGEGKYDFVTAYGGNIFPAADKYGSIMVICNGTSDGLIILAYTGEAHNVEAEKCVMDGAPTTVRAVVIFDNRVVAFGSEDNNSEIRWTEQGRFDHWDPGVYPSAGSHILGESPDWIQTARRLGEYLIVYKERSIHIGHKSFIADPAIVFNPAPGQGIGLSAPMSVGDLGEEHIFLGWDDVYVFSLKALEPIGTRIKNELFYGDNGILPEYLCNCTGIVAEEFSEYWLFVPTGKWPDADGEAIDNLIVNPVLKDDNADDVPDDWTVDTKVNGTKAVNTGGLFGNSILELYDPDGEDVEFNQTYDFGALQGSGLTLTMRIWLTPTEGHATEGCKFEVKLTELDNGDVAGTYHTFNFVYDADEYDIETHQDMSFVSADGDFEKLKVQIILDQADSKIEFDAIHLLDITDVDDSYLTTVAGNQIVGYLDGALEVQEIPFVVDSVGKWLPDTVWVFNYEENSWVAWRMPMSGFGYDSLQDIISIAELVGLVSEQGWRYGEKRIEKFAPTNLIGQCDSNIYEVSSLAARDWGGVLDTSFLAYWQSKDIDLNVPGVDKTFSRIVIHHETSHSPMTVTVGISTNSGLDWIERDVTIQQGRTKTFADFFVTGPQARFQVKSVPPGFVINGFTIKILPRGEANDYDV